MRCVTVMGPSQSGKTELIRKLAAVDGHPAKSESAGPLALTRFTYLGEPWCALDLAGGPEYARMAARPLLASDAVVLCVAADPAEAVLAAPYLRAIEASGTPCLIFINRIDAAKGRIRDVVAALQAYTGHTIVLRQIPIREDGRIVGAVDLISERAWRYRDGQSSVLVELPQSEAERERDDQESRRARVRLVERGHRHIADPQEHERSDQLGRETFQLDLRRQ